MKKRNIAIILFTLGVLVSMLTPFYFVTAIFVLGAITLLIISLYKKEEKKWISVLFLILSVLYSISFVYLFFVGNSSLLGEMVEKSYEHSISPFYTQPIQGQGKNVIRTGLMNFGDPIMLTFEGNGGEKCINPKISAEKEGYEINQSTVIESDETFVIFWDCEEIVSEGDRFSGYFEFNYIRNGEENTYRFPYSGRYK